MNYTQTHPYKILKFIIKIRRYIYEWLKEKIQNAKIQNEKETANAIKYKTNKT